MKPTKLDKEIRDIIYAIYLARDQINGGTKVKLRNRLFKLMAISPSAKHLEYYFSKLNRTKQNALFRRCKMVEFLK